MKRRTHKECARWIKHEVRKYHFCKRSRSSPKSIHRSIPEGPGVHQAWAGESDVSK